MKLQYSLLLPRVLRGISLLCLSIAVISMYLTMRESLSFGNEEPTKIPKNAVVYVHKQGRGYTSEDVIVKTCVEVSRETGCRPAPSSSGFYSVITVVDNEERNNGPRP